MPTEEENKAAEEQEAMKNATNVKPGFANVVTEGGPGSPTNAAGPGAGQPGGEGPSASSRLGPHGSEEPNDPEPGQPGYRGLPAGAASNPGKSRDSDDEQRNPGVRSSRKS